MAIEEVPNSEPKENNQLLDEDILDIRGLTINYQAIGPDYVAILLDIDQDDYHSRWIVYNSQRRAGVQEAIRRHQESRLALLQSARLLDLFNKKFPDRRLN